MGAKELHCVVRDKFSSLRVVRYKEATGQTFKELNAKFNLHPDSTWSYFDRENRFMCIRREWQFQKALLDCPEGKELRLWQQCGTASMYWIDKL